MARKYTYQTNKTSPNRNAGRVGGRPTGITIHHWGSLGQKHANVVAWLCNRAAGTSAHYVVSSGLVSCIVDPDDTAWHAGNRNANRRTIGIECRPEMSDGDFETVAQLIADLRATYGNLPLYPHKHWTNTACPGRWASNLSRLSKRADEIRGGSKTQTKPAKPTPQPTTKVDEDGRLGTQTVKALQRFLNKKVSGKDIAVDGRAGAATWRKLQTYLKAPYVDGIISRQSYTAKALGNGIVAGKTWGYTGRGSKGSQTVKLLQKLIGVTADGVWGPNTTKALQRYLNREG